MLIGINGYIGSGKDTVAQLIQFLTLKAKGQYLVNNPATAKHWLSFSPQGQQSWLTENGNWQIKKFAFKLKQMVSLLTGIPVEDLEKQEVKDSILPEEWNWAFKVVRENDKWINIHGIVPKGFDRAKQITVRQLLQWFGTEAGRNQVHENIWVNALMSDYKNKSNIDWAKKRNEKGWVPPFCINCGKITEAIDMFVCKTCLITHVSYPNWIISDCRFPNEAQAIKERDGLVIRINRYSYLKDPESFAARMIGEKQPLGLNMYNAAKRLDLHPSETSLDDYPFDYVIENNGTLEELLIEVEKMLTHFKII